MLGYILIVILVALTGFLFVVARKPDTFRYVRATTVKAPPEKIAPFIEDFRRWTAWSPYEHRDPNLQRTYDGAERGRGARYAWVGNKSVGQGRMEILEVSPTKIVIELEFFKPFKARNIAEFTLRPVANGTEVSWAMSGPNLFMTKVMDTFMSMDKMIGKDFETGLAKLKEAAEA